MSAAAEAGRKARWTPGRIAMLVAAAVLAVAWLLPLAWALATSLKPEGETTKTPLEWFGSKITFDAYRQVWAAGDLGR